MSPCLLHRKRGLQQRREQRHEEALRAAETVDAELRELATASRRLRPHGQEASGRRRTQVLNAAYLVAEGRAADVSRLVGLLENRTGAEIEISGPWVPYSFVGGV
ncbi:GvpL/GvpF family gas vesicle protein [Streptomyces sp. NPDC051217]|uniref:GvpL/GvpF family gas vesicle protein n=1 Tax=Streptomyces sp. NPDC051217 TaxID=3365644 RepID=UPI0037B58AE1